MKETSRSDRSNPALRRSVIGTINFPRVLQFTWWTCGPCSAYSVLQHFGRETEYEDVVEELGTTRRRGTTEDSMVRVLRDNGLSIEVEPDTSWTGLMNSLSADNAVVVDMDCGRHYAVAYGYDRSTDQVYLADPSIWRVWGRCMSRQAFLRRWTGGGLHAQLRGARSSSFSTSMRY